MLYNIVLVSAIHQHESAIGIHMSSPMNLPPTSHPFPPCRLLQSPSLSSLSHTANSHWLSILHMVVYMLLCYSLHSSHLLLPPHCLSISLFSMSASPFSSVQFSRSVVSNSLGSHESQHARPSCPSPTPRVHPDSRPLSQ